MTKRKEYKESRHCGESAAMLAGVGIITTIFGVAVPNPAVKAAVTLSGVALTGVGFVACYHAAEESAQIYSEMNEFEKAVTDVEKIIDKYCS